LSLNGKKRPEDDDCRLATESTPRKANSALFRCAISGGDGFHVDPYGNTFSCALIRRPVFNLLKTEITSALNQSLSRVRNRRFTTASECNGCRLRELCRSCPGRAYLETGDLEAPVEYYCRLAEEMVKGGKKKL
jgi:radical SAM protein with 4Fe4S-binding SPASM domain